MKSIRFQICLLIVIALCSCSRPTRLARQIANADFLIATNHNDSVGLSVTGKDAHEIVQAIASSKKHRGAPLELGFDFRIEFYKGTNLLGWANVGTLGHGFWDGKAHYIPQSNALKVLAEKFQRKRQEILFNETAR